MTRNPHYLRAKVGDLVVVVTSHTKYTRSTGQRIWLECEVAEVTAVGEHGRVKSMRFAVGGVERRRKYLSDLVALVPFAATDISVALAMRAAREYGKPFASLEDVRAAVRPFVLIDLAARGYSPQLGEHGDEAERGAEDRDACTVCGLNFTEEQDAEDDQRQVVASTLYAHAACVESEAGR